MKKLIYLAAILALTSCDDNKTDTAGTYDNPYISVTPKLSGVIPTDVTIPEFAGPSEPMDDPAPLAIHNRPFFDNFSWQSFIALSWPADISARGIAIDPNNNDIFLSANKSGESSIPIVWETYREGFVLFPPDGTVPPEWNSPEPGYSPAGDAHTDKRIFAMTTKGGLADEVNEAFGGPLIDQNGNYVRYEVRVNEIEYEQARKNKWYDKDTLKKDIETAVKNSTSTAQGIQFDTNSIELKAAWRIMTDDDDLSRYYVVQGLVAGTNGSYVSAKMGLVGLHIMQKTESFPQWVWSTFEHVDNVKGPHPSFNNGKDSPIMPPNATDCKTPLLTIRQSQDSGYDCEPYEIKAPYTSVPAGTGRPVQVTRIDPIPSTPVNPFGYSTAALNKKYQKLLGDTVWKNYELIGTQWPTNPALPSPYNPAFMPETQYKPDLAGDPFPKHVANVTMETYFQDNSCMQCHYHAAAFGTDYSWVIYNRVLKDSGD